MVNEADMHVEEVPASHKQKFQRYIIFGVIGMILICVAALYMNSAHRKEKALDAQAKIEAADKQKAAANALKQPKSPTAAFDEDIEGRRAQLLKQIAEAEANGQMPTDPKTLAAIKRIRDAQATGDGRGGERTAGNAGNTVYQGGNSGGMSGTKDPIRDWQLKEKLRALDSTRKPYDLNAASKGGSGGALGGTRIDTNAPLSEQQQQVKQRIAEVEQLKQKLLSGNIDADSATKLLTGSALKQPAANSSSDLVTGFTASKAGQYGDSIQGKTLLPTGTVISAVLSQDLISDYAGSFKGQITHDVYDADYEKILVPKGTNVVGKIMRIRNINEPIQARMGMIVTWFVLPNGKRIDMSKASTAEDSAGVGAMEGDVNYHFMAQFLGVAAYAMLVSETSQNTSAPLTGEVNVQGDIERSMATQFAPLAQRYLTLVPTITLHAGMPFKVFIEDDVFLKPWATIYDKLVSAH